MAGATHPQPVRETQERKEAKRGGKSSKDPQSRCRRSVKFTIRYSLAFRLFICFILGVNDDAINTVPHYHSNFRVAFQQDLAFDVLRLLSQSEIIHSQPEILIPGPTVFEEVYSVLTLRNRSISIILLACPLSNKRSRHVCVCVIFCIYLTTCQKAVERLRGSVNGSEGRKR